MVTNKSSWQPLDAYNAKYEKSRINKNWKKLEKNERAGRRNGAPLWDPVSIFSLFRKSWKWWKFLLNMRDVALLSARILERQEIEYEYVSYFEVCHFVNSTGLAAYNIVQMYRFKSLTNWKEWVWSYRMNYCHFYNFNLFNDYISNRTSSTIFCKESSGSCLVEHSMNEAMWYEVFFKKFLSVKNEALIESRKATLHCM